MIHLWKGRKPLWCVVAIALDPQGLKPKCLLPLIGTAEQVAAKLIPERKV